MTCVLRVFKIEMVEKNTWQTASLADRENLNTHHIFKIFSIEIVLCVSSLFPLFFIFSLNDNPSKTMGNAFYFI